MVSPRVQNGFGKDLESVPHTDPSWLDIEARFRKEVNKMHMEQWLRLIAGVIILGSVLLTYYHSLSWLWLTGLMGANLLQSGFTDW